MPAGPFLVRFLKGNVTLICGALILFAVSTRSQAGLMFSAVESAGSVVITASGTANLSGLAAGGSMLFPGGRLQPDKGIVVGALSTPVDLYFGSVSGAPNFGPGTEPLVNADSGSGDLFG